MELREWRPVIFGIAAGFLFLLSDQLLFKAPSDFPVNQVIIVPQGLTLDDTAKLLREKNVITSPIFFSIVTNFLSKDRVVAGAYMFERRLTVFDIALRTASGDYHLAPLRVTFTEGETLKDMAGECKAVLSQCDVAGFLALTKGKEGYLFPDTYFVLPTATASQVVDAATRNFDLKIATLDTEITNFGKPLPQILTMASILEKEASSTTDRKIISGILWKRIKLGMALQVDAPFDYILNKNTYELTANDLKIKSPYNTYTNTGLPPTPIGNPGLDSIEAAVEPTETPYLYYLSDKKGNLHYAKTFDEHVANKQKYLN